ncbi:MAG TPA: Rieske 2Fe-2S domain-containing protein [Gemmatimonadaceae bacterium]|nr:Rieske 2Fe-2S domain-containing protein [Gemmatimonadaceae bacterium]
MSDESNIHAECEEQNCFVSRDRRRFLRDSFLSVAGAMIAVGVNKSTALAMPLDFTSATNAGGSMRSYTVPAADGAQIDKENEVILVRWQNAIYAFDLSCPHQNTALKWNDNDHEFQCPKHHSKFQPDGTYEQGSGRATRNMDRFAISKQGTGVAVDLDKLYQEDTDGAQWAAAVVKL